jgi:hypothetical protein
MGMNCSLLLTDFFLHAYEADFLQSLLKNKDGKLTQTFNPANAIYMKFFHWTVLDSVIIYITSFQMSLKLRLLLILKTLLLPWPSSWDKHEGRLKTKLYDKCDNFTFPIVDFPFIISNIPASPPYGVYISQLIRYSRACDQYSDFLDIAQLLMQKLLKQGYAAPSLQSTSQSGWPLQNIHISNDNGSFTFYVDFSFFYHCQDFYRTVYMSNTAGVL